MLSCSLCKKTLLRFFCFSATQNNRKVFQFMQGKSMPKDAPLRRPSSALTYPCLACGKPLARRIGMRRKNGQPGEFYAGSNTRCGQSQHSAEDGPPLYGLLQDFRR
jgi:hypothetical protein